MIWEEFEKRAEKYAGLPALVSPDRTMSYADVLAAVPRLAATLPGPGGPRPRRVVIRQTSPLAVILSVLACWRGGCVPLILRGRTPEAGELIRWLRPAAVLCDDNPPGSTASPMERGGDSVFAPRDEALVVCTSGTTAAPKLVALPAESVCLNATTIASSLELTPGDRVAVNTPLGYMYGLMGGCMASLWAGATCFLFDPREPLTRLQAGIRDRGISVVQGPPSLFRLFFAYADGARFDGVRLVTTGGEAFSEQLPADLGRTFPRARRLVLYGMTEAGPRISHEAVANGGGRNGCVGVPYPHLSICFDRPGRAVQGLPESHDSMGAHDLTKGPFHERLDSAESGREDGRDWDFFTVWRRRLFVGVLAGFIVAWPLFVSWSVLTRGAGMLYQDSFDYLETLAAWQAGGGLPSGSWLGELFEPQNDSRHAVGRFLFTLWVILDGRNTDSLLVFNLVGAALGAFLCATLAKKSRPDLPREFHLAVAAGFVLLFFSFGHRQSWPFHIQAGHFFLPVFLALAWHVNFTKWSLPAKAAVNCLLAMAGMFSYAGGLAIWLLCFPWPARGTGLENRDFPDRRPTCREILAWTGYAMVGAVCVSVYVLNMQAVGVTEDALKSHVSPAMRAAYVAVWVGTAWNYGDWNIALWVGAATLVVLCMAGLFVLVHGPARRNPGAWAFLAFCAFGVLMGAMASIGRAHEGVPQAMSHRYFTMQSTILVGLLGLAAVLAPGPKRLRALAKSPFAGFTGGLVVAWLVIQQATYHQYFIKHTDELRQATLIVKARNFLPNHPAAWIVLLMDMEKLNVHLLPMINLGLLSEYLPPRLSLDAYSTRPEKSAFPENMLGHWDSCSAVLFSDPDRAPELQVSGWAASAADRPAELVLFTYQGPDGEARPFHLMATGFKRPDVAKIYPGLLRSGFRANIPMSLLPRGRSHHIAAWSYNPGDGSVVPLANSFQVDMPFFSVQQLP